MQKYLNRLIIFTEMLLVDKKANRFLIKKQNYQFSSAMKNLIFFLKISMDIIRKHAEDIICVK